MNDPWIIVDGVPLPPPSNKSGYSKYAFSDMKVGQSFYFPNHPPKRISAIARFWGKKLDRAFTIRKEGTGARVWRIR